jgi:putative oxidoreductase
MSNSSDSVLPLIGRILISMIFINAGISKVFGHAMMTGYAAAKGIPAPGLAIWVACAIELVGGLAILVGLQARIAAWVLFLYLIPTSIFMHNFWALQGAEKMNNQIHFFKNLAIMGGFLFIATFGPGAYSVDSARSKTV